MIKHSDDIAIEIGVDENGPFVVGKWQSGKKTYAAAIAILRSNMAEWKGALLMIQDAYDKHKKLSHR